jgi:hypothetical protein
MKVMRDSAGIVKIQSVALIITAITSGTILCGIALSQFISTVKLP